MGNKKINSLQDLGLVFSTGSAESFEDMDLNETEGLSMGDQQPRVYLDRKKRKGKSVTIISQLSLPQKSLEELGKELKSKCGVGGTIKDGLILLQGDQRKKVLQELINKGYKKAKISGA